MIWFAINAPFFLKDYKKGWGNGYIAVPPSHFLWGMDYDKINELVDVHYGLTFSDVIDSGSTAFKEHAPEGYWVFGFDTAHYDDSLEKWPKEAVEAETKKLFAQIFELDMGDLF
jgi:hypothetical protein